MTAPALLGLAALFFGLLSFFARVDAPYGVGRFLASGQGPRLLIAQISFGESLWFWISIGAVALLVHFSEWLTKDSVGQVLGVALGVGVFATLLVDIFKLWPGRVRRRLSRLFLAAAGDNQQRKTIVYQEASHLSSTENGVSANAMTRIRSAW